MTIKITNDLTQIDYPRYDSYIDSGVDWLGEIPEGWNTQKLKYVVSIKKRIIGHEGVDVLSITQSGIKVKDITTGGGQLSMDYSKYQIVHEGDFAMNHMDLLTGYVDISNHDGVVSPDYRVFINDSNDVDNEYLLKIFQMGYSQKIFFKYGQGVSMLGRWRLPADNFNNFLIPVPSLDEQNKIIAFLESKTTQIDQAINLKQQQIAKLEEYKQIVIQNAVTKGLNPDASMKDSGVDWIGDIPEHWEVKRLMFVTENFNQKVLGSESKLPYLGMESIESKTGQLSNETSEAEGLASYFKEDQILFGKLRPYLAKVYLTNFEGLCSTEFMVMSVRSEISNTFLKYQLLSNRFIAQINSSTYGSKMPRASAEYIKRQSITLPPTEEQKLIVDYIDSTTNKVNKTLSSYNSQIDRLKEYKTILINQAVTGKIKVS